VYLPIWLGFTWAELKRETGDERMRPVGHAFSLFVPGTATGRSIATSV